MVLDTGKEPAVAPEFDAGPQPPEPRRSLLIQGTVVPVTFLPTRELTVALTDVVTIVSDAGPLIALAIVAWLFKTWMEARVRGKLAAAHSQELIRAILTNDQQARRLAPLRWGIVLVGLAIALAIIDAAGWQEATPGVFAVLLGATGVANLAAFAVSQWLTSRKERS
jgi:hypothetical protein